MGTCISKCCLNSPNNNHHHPSSPPQDKLVISQSPHPLPLKQEQLLPASSSSSASSSTFSSCTSISTSSSSSTPVSSKPVPYSNGFLLSCAKENPRIIVLDPHTYHAPKPKPRGIASPVPARQQRNHCSVRLPAKRERSSSPQQRAVARQKSSSMGEMIVKQPAVVSEPIRTLSSPNNVRWRSEKIRALSPCNSWLNLKENPLVEDIDNPLISMECFIFL